MFKNMTIGKKIIFGFSLVLIILAIVACISFNTLKGAASGFKTYRETARDNNLIGQLQAHILMTQMNVKDFIITGSEKDHRQFLQYSEISDDFLKEAQEAIHNKERAANIDLIDNDMKDYKNGFAQLVTFAGRRNSLVDDVLNVKGPLMENTLTDIMLSAQKDEDSSVAFNAGIAMKHLLLGRLYMVKFLDDNSEKSVTRVKDEFGKMQAQLDTLDKRFQNADRRKMLVIVSEAKQAYVNGFNKLVTTIYDRNNVISGTLDRIGPEAAKAVEDVKLSLKDEQDILGPKVNAGNSFAIVLISIVSIGAVLLGITLAWFITRGIVITLKKIIVSLSEGAEQVISAAEEVSAASQSLAEGVTEQATGLEETSSSLEEMSSMTKQNADNAQQANTLAEQTRKAAHTGSEAMGKMDTAIKQIQKSSDKMAKITKAIDEIAFQANLLALNAAVEAAGAGKAGKGFAVVAEEVRNLAMRSADVAKNTSEMIEESVKNSKNGVDIAGKVGKMLNQIVEGISKTTDLVGEITAASQEQSQGIDQVNKTVGKMDKVTQQNAANAEESASVSEELSAQAEQMMRVVKELIALVNGGSDTGDSSTRTKSQSAHALAPSDHTFHQIANGGSSNGGSSKDGLSKGDSSKDGLFDGGSPKGGSSKKKSRTVKAAPSRTIPLEDEDSNEDGLGKFNS